MSGARKLLLPLLPAYKLALWLREHRLGTSLEPIQRLKYPVVSIGNLSTGGAGKTPLCIALANALSKRGYQVDVLSRGYGRRDGTAALVDSAGTADEFGDEPLLIARDTQTRVYVAAQRFAAGQLAESDALANQTSKQANLIHLLDDGFQHRQLHRDVDIVLLDRNDLHDWLLPAGNLREPVQAVNRASIVAVPADDTELEVQLRGLGFTGQVWRIRRRMSVPAIDGSVLGFCGIARPDQFFAGLSASGLKITSQIAFRDHHPYTRKDVDRLLDAAHSAEAAALITTGKDLVRLGKLAEAITKKLPLQTAGLHIDIEDEERVISDLLRGMGDKAAQ